MKRNLLQYEALEETNTPSSRKTQERIEVLWDKIVDLIIKLRNPKKDIITDGIYQVDKRDIIFSTKLKSTNDETQEIQATMNLEYFVSSKSIMTSIQFPDESKTGFCLITDQYEFSHRQVFYRGITYNDQEISFKKEDNPSQVIERFQHLCSTLEEWLKKESDITKEQIKTTLNGEDLQI